MCCFLNKNKMLGGNIIGIILIVISILFLIAFLVLNALNAAVDSQFRLDDINTGWKTKLISISLLFFVAGILTIYFSTRKKNKTTKQ